MITYIIIGIIVQLIITAERAVRFPENWTGEELKHWAFWVIFILYAIFNVISWPLAIVCEIYNIIKKQ